MTRSRIDERTVRDHPPLPADEYDDAYDVVCPACGARPGLECRFLLDGLPVGRAKARPHRTRVEAADR